MRRRARAQLGEAVEQLEVAGRTQQLRLLELSVDVDQRVAELGQQRDRRRAAVDVDAALAGARQMAADQDLAVVEPERLAQLVGHAAFEQAFDRCLVGVAADQVGGRPRPAQQRQRLQDDALAGAGLAGQDVQAGTEARAPGRR